ncbi:MAG: hypothetical protein R2939_05805 [Kofleriaceae bacterium]
MRVLGVLLGVVGSIVTVGAVIEIFRARRPRDVAAALVATIGVATAVLGLVWAVAPNAL